MSPERRRKTTDRSAKDFLDSERAVMARAVIGDQAPGARLCRNRASARRARSKVARCRLSLAPWARASGSSNSGDQDLGVGEALGVGGHERERAAGIDVEGGPAPGLRQGPPRGLAGAGRSPVILVHPSILADITARGRQAGSMPAGLELRLGPMWCGDAVPGDGVLPEKRTSGPHHARVPPVRSSRWMPGSSSPRSARSGCTLPPKPKPSGRSAPTPRQCSGSPPTTWPGRQARARGTRSAGGISSGGWRPCLAGTAARTPATSSAR